jgi:hypothetical protein
MQRMTLPGLAPDVLASYASDIVRAFGAARSFDIPGDMRARAQIRERVREVLAEIRPHPEGPSIAEALADLLEDARRGWRDPAGAAGHLAELAALFEQAAFRRTKRAERGRLFAELIVLFEIEAATGLGSGPEACIDAEAHLKLVRRRLRRNAH